MTVSSFYDFLALETKICSGINRSEILVEGYVVMRSKIIKRWAIFIAVLSLIGGTGFFTQRFQVTRQAKSVEAKADAAVKDGDFAEAERLYREHLVVFPDDVEIKIKYADALLKADPSPRRQDEALQVYAGILKGHAGLADVRRKQMQVQIDKGNFPAA